MTTETVMPEAAFRISLISGEVNTDIQISSTMAGCVANAETPPCLRSNGEFEQHGTRENRLIGLLRFSIVPGRRSSGLPADPETCEDYPETCSLSLLDCAASGREPRPRAILPAARET